MATTIRWKRWTPKEDKILLTQVKAFPQNLNKCFITVAQQTGRTKGAVSLRWYTVLSKDKKNLAFFTASPHAVTRNKKNSDDYTKSTMSLWYKFRALLRMLK